VGLCTIRFCRALLDDEGRLVEPVLSWMDERVSRPHDPSDGRVARVTTSSGYVTHRLTGRYVDTCANYQGVWPIDRRTATWSTDPGAYDATGMPRRLLFDLVPPGGLLGCVTREAAAASGIPAGLPVYATANDKAVEALGCGLGDEDTVLLSLGTYIAATATGATPPAVVGSPADAYWVNFGSRPGEYLYEGRGIRRGMWTVSWFRDLVSGADAAGLPAGGRTTEETLNIEAASVPAGCGGLMTLLDWLPPAEAPHRRGAFIGFDGTQGRAHIYRSMLEGIALTMGGHIERMQEDLGRHFTSVVVAGGGSRSDVMMQILADVLDRPVSRPAMPDAAGLGAAICAAVGAGVHRDWDTAVTEMVARGPGFTPDPTGVAAYRRIARVYSRLYAMTDPLFAWTGGGDQPEGAGSTAPSGTPSP
jgi:sugar (pentulose or hexulose) kinase